MGVARRRLTAGLAPFTLAGRPVAYSPALEVEGITRLVFVSGTTAARPDGSIADGIEAQVRQALDNISVLLGEAGARMDDIVKLTCWLTKREFAETYVRVRQEYFTTGVPASSTVISDLVQPELLVEIEAIAAVA